MIAFKICLRISGLIFIIALTGCGNFFSCAGFKWQKFSTILCKLIWEENLEFFNIDVHELQKVVNKDFIELQKYGIS